MRDESAGAWLRESRLAVGLTQEALAARSGISVRTISDLERGVSARPYPRSVRLLAEALALPRHLADEVITSYRNRGAPAGRWAHTAAGDAGGLARYDLPAVAAHFTGRASPGGEQGRTGNVPMVVPRQLPPKTAHFAGRERELGALSALLGKVGAGGTVVISAIAGTAGIGKTALAVHWAHQVAGRFPDGQLYVNLRGFDPSGTPTTPAEALQGFLGAVGVPPEQIPVGLQAQAGLYRSVVADRRLLIVLDNARNTDQVRPLLPASPGCLVLVTSRAFLAGLTIGEGAHLLALDLLTEAEARQLLAARLGADRPAAESGAVDELIDLCAGLPLALAIAAARAADHPQFPLALLATELRDTASRLDALDTGEPAASIRAVFSWSYQNLDEPVAWMFRLVGMHPGPDITGPAAASLAGIPVPAARRALRELAMAHLLNEHSPGRYVFHDLLRAYAIEQSRTTDHEETRRSATGRVLDHYLHTAHAAALLLNPSRELDGLAPARPDTMPEDLAGHQQALAWFEAERPVLLSAVTLAAETGFDACAWQLPWTMTDFLDWRGHWHDWAAIQRTALAAATRRDDTGGQAAARLLLAQVCARTGDYDQACAHLTDGLGLYRQLGDRAGEARVRQTLCWVAVHQDSFAHALSHAEQALALFRAIADRAGQAWALNNVGYCLVLLGDPQRARKFCQQALALHRELDTRAGESKAWDSLGYVEHQLGHLTEAAACYQHALSLARELGDRAGEAETLTNLGDTHHAAGKPRKAWDTWQQALSILNELHHPDADQVRAKLSQLC